MTKNKIIVICGPTASGKTAFSIELAKRIDGEIISADSMQIYKEMFIGTARPSQEEMQGIQHYLVGTVEPNRRYSVSEFRSDAENYINCILKENKMPIIVGGTGLYVNSLVYGIEYPELKIDLNYRTELETEAEKYGLDYLYNRACKIDSEAMKKISINDKKRILRVLEIYKQTGKTKTELEIESRKNEVKYDYKIFAINMPRDYLYERINKRVDLMVERGLISEVETLYLKYGETLLTSVQAIGYKEVISYIKRECSKEEMIEKIKLETRRYAKRQITWFKKIDSIQWLDGLNDIQNNIDIILEGI